MYLSSRYIVPAIAKAIAGTATDAAAPALLAIARDVARRSVLSCEVCSGTGVSPRDGRSACHRCDGCGEYVEPCILTPQDVREARRAIERATTN